MSKGEKHSTCIDRNLTVHITYWRCILIRKNAEVGTKPLSDREKVAKLEAEPNVKVYRSMQIIDGKLYPPMSAKVDSKLAIINIRNISQNTKVTRKSSTFAA